MPFAEPVVLKGERLDHREGLLLELAAGDGTSGWGETSPLPGFSRESLYEGGRQLNELASAFLGNPLPEVGPLPDGDFPGNELNRRELAPSARFGFELATCNIYAISQGKALPEVFSDKPGATVSLNGLLAGSRRHVLEEARGMLEAGYEAVKLKVGSRGLVEDVELVGAVVEILGEKVALRLDANRAWSFEEAGAFFRATSSLGYEYVEEPLAEPAGLARLAGGYGVRVALDESLVGMEPEVLGDHRYARAVVLKPTLLGGISRTLRLAREAGRLGIVPVVSSAYETGVGTAALVSLAAGIGGSDIPAGLDTYRRLARDVLEPALDLSTPCVDVRRIFDRYAIDRSRLELVYSSET